MGNDYLRDMTRYFEILEFIAMNNHNTSIT